MLSSLAEEQQNLDLSQSGRSEESELIDADAIIEDNEGSTNKLSKSQLEGVKVTMLGAPISENAEQNKDQDLDLHDSQSDFFGTEIMATS